MTAKRVHGKRGRRFLWIAYDTGGSDITPFAQEEIANDFPHALQIIAAHLPPDSDDLDKITIWEAKDGDA